MGGRGRGTSSFTPEQLQALGMQTINKDSLPAGPPPLFPPLFSKPARLKSNADMDYKVMWKEDFFLGLRESPYYISSVQSRKPVDKPNFNYKSFPLILTPGRKGLKPASSAPLPPKKKQKTMDINETLRILEQKEVKTGADVKVKNEPRSDAEDEEELEPEDQDQEMDDENDYDNNYFDNGEDFVDEDDNLDDGPVY